MPRCYLLAVARGSSLDTDGNNFSLFTLVEELTYSPPDQAAGGPAILPLELHAYWSLSPGELNRDFQFRIAFTGQEPVPTSDALPLRSDKSRHRLRVRGLPMLATGDIELQVEWREKGQQEWRRESTFWPLQMRQTT